MAYLASDVIGMAQYRNLRNKTDLVSNAEAVDALDRYQRHIYIRAARENPEYFGTNLTTSARSSYTGEWDLSGSRVVAISRIEADTITGTVSGVSAGQELFMVQLKNPNLMPAPRAYVRGRKVWGYGTELGADNSNMVTKLKVYYSPFPAQMVDETSYLTLPDEWVNLLVLPLARLFAIRDGGRENEVQMLDQEYGAELEQFTEAVKIYDYGATRPLTAIRALPAPVSGGQ